MKTSVIGYPRIGKNRELKFALEKFFKRAITAQEMQNTAATLRKAHWSIQQESGVNFIPSNDFSFYDHILDTAVLLNVIPKRYKALGLMSLDELFAMARGYQGENGDVKALAMKKWFNTNYHYMVPEIDDDTVIKLVGAKPFDEFTEAKNLGITTKPVMIGAFTFLKLARFTGKKNIKDFTVDVIKAFSEILAKFGALGAEWIQFDEPILVTDLTAEDLTLFTNLYSEILSAKGKVKVLAQTYFGDIRDCYHKVTQLPFDGVGLDFVEGRKSLELVKNYGFPNDKVLFAGVVNGKNIWKNHYEKTTQTLKTLKTFSEHLVLNTSCSLLHVPYTLENETKLSYEYKEHLAFAEEKLSELADLKKILLSKVSDETSEYIQNTKVFRRNRDCSSMAVQAKVSALSSHDFTRLPVFTEREKIQKAVFRLPLLPTTTIGSFPQTADVKANRAAFRNDNITEEQYKDFNKKKIAKCIVLQEEIGLDVLVHGEFERNDMVEYFGEALNGFIFTQKAWVQSYGTRCVKPPIIWGDISRSKAITVEYSVYAQSLTEKPVKGMLTGPVTILNWSFPREDISLKESAWQIALAIREELLDLEANGIKIIQVDEAALREKLPLRKTDWQEEYLSWAIPAFRLVHSGCRAETQIHTHMCYSEFESIIKDIDEMDADVITFEASRSNLAIIDVLNACHFKTEVGPGVYDIHSPRVPHVEEIKTALLNMLNKINSIKLWVNPDCGLKTRENRETIQSLKNMVTAAIEIRESL